MNRGLACCCRLDDVPCDLSSAFLMLDRLTDRELTDWQLTELIDWLTLLVISLLIIIRSIFLLAISLLLIR